jgi:hypothetical protein
MKATICLSAMMALLAINLSCAAQKDSSGIYRTADDFRNHKLTLAINYKTEQHKIKAGLFSDAAHFNVKHQDSTYTLDKSNTYGYKNTQGEVFRFVDNTAYRIINSDETILLYLHTLPISPVVNPTIRVEEHYYFSKDAAGSLVELTLVNLKKAFGDNPKFVALLNRYFEKDEQLLSYDANRQMYTVNRLLQWSRQ